MGGTLDDAKGRAKEAVGDLTDDDDLKREGRLDQAGSKVKDVADKAGEKIEEAVDKVKEAINRKK